MLTGGYRSTTSMRGAPATNTEALQTDVMRFIAIIGLCLTAIFSLMRSIAEPVENSKDKTENQVLRQQLNSLQEKLTQGNESTQLLKDNLSSSQAQLAHASQQEHELQQMHKELSGLSQALNNRHQEQLKLEQTLANTRKQTQNLRAQLRDKQQQVEPAQIEQPQARTPVNDSAATAPPPKGFRQPGFVLKFASESTLSELIYKDQVKLLAVVNLQAWQLRLHKQHPGFHKIPMPDKYYEMLPETLPAAYRQAFYADIDQTGNTGTVWAVQIPLSTEQQVQRMLKTTDNGELIIQADGSVSLLSGAN
jgi:hypothetical protein